MAEINDLNITDASNTARWPENMAPSAVNNAGRADEGLLARWHKDTNGSLLATGLVNVFAVAANQTLSAYYDGLVIAFEANLTNTGSATLNVDAVSADTIVLPSGAALQAGEIQSGQKVNVVHDGTNWVMFSPPSYANGFYNVRDSGATGDGTTDDTTAINAAFTLADTLGASVMIPPGTYIVTSRIVLNAPAWGLKNNQTIIKAGASFSTAASATFDGATDVDDVAETITLTAHPFSTGDPVQYEDGGGTTIGGLGDKGIYWMKSVDANTVQIAANEADAASGPYINLTDGVGAAHSFTRWTQIIDMHIPGGTDGRKFLRDFTIDCNSIPGLAGLGSTSPSGAGGSATSEITNVQIENGWTDRYAIQARGDGPTDSGFGGFLTGCVCNHLTTRNCHLAMAVDQKQDNVTFNSSRFHADGSSQGTETLPFLDLACQGSVFHGLFLGAINDTGYTIAGPGTFKALVLLSGDQDKPIQMYGVHVEAKAGTGATLTHIFASINSGVCRVEGLHINYEDVNNVARAIFYQRVNSSNLNPSWSLSRVSEGTESGNTFPLMIETDRSNNSDDSDNSVEMVFDQCDGGNFDDFPFGMVRTTANNQEEGYFLKLHGNYKGKRYDHGVNEGDITSFAITSGDRVRTETFDSVADVDPSTDQITLTAHQFMTGTALYYEDQGGTAPTGMTDETKIFAIKVDDNTIQVAPTRADAFAGTQINITADGIGTGHTLTRMHKQKPLTAFDSINFQSTSVTSPDAQTFRLPGEGVWRVSVVAREDGDSDDVARAVFDITYMNRGTLFAVTNSLVASAAIGTATSIAAGTPDAQGDVTYTFTHGAGTVSNRWFITYEKMSATA